MQCDTSGDTAGIATDVTMVDAILKGSSVLLLLSLSQTQRKLTMLTVHMFYKLIRETNLYMQVKLNERIYM